MPQTVDSLVRLLGLSPHPEGGFYREVFRSALAITHPSNPEKTRNASTAIYFLLPTGSFSAFHRVSSDEVWHHYDGDPVNLHTIDAQGNYAITALGPDFALGQRPQVVVPAGVLQAAAPLGDRYALCGCTVAPGFDFADFEMPARAKLVELYPMHRALIEALTR